MKTDWHRMIELWKSKQLEFEHRPSQASKRSVKLRAKGCGLRNDKHCRIIAEKLNPERGANQ